MLVHTRSAELPRIKGQSWLLDSICHVNAEGGKGSSSCCSSTSRRKCRQGEGPHADSGQPRLQSGLQACIPCLIESIGLVLSRAVLVVKSSSTYNQKGLAANVLRGLHSQQQ